jgi:hypothetical protein
LGTGNCDAKTDLNVMIAKCADPVTCNPRFCRCTPGDGSFIFDPTQSPSPPPSQPPPTPPLISVAERFRTACANEQPAYCNFQPDVAGFCVYEGGFGTDCIRDTDVSVMATKCADVATCSDKFCNCDAGTFNFDASQSPSPPPPPMLVATPEFVHKCMLKSANCEYAVDGEVFCKLHFTPTECLPSTDLFGMRNRCADAATCNPEFCDCSDGSFTYDV